MKRTALKRRTPLRAKRWGVGRKKGGTKHSRRPREWGFMAFCKARGCELFLDIDTQRLVGLSHRCWGFRVGHVAVEFAHLGDRKRYASGDVGAGLCTEIHRGIDGKVGGKAPWFVVLGKSGQKLLRDRLSNRARADWDALSPEERNAWEESAKAWRASAGRKREAA